MLARRRLGVVICVHTCVKVLFLVFVCLFRYKYAGAIWLPLYIVFNLFIFCIVLLIPCWLRSHLSTETAAESDFPPVAKMHPGLAS